MESQKHGNVFEEEIIRVITGKSKEEYNTYIPNGYTASMDIVRGIHSDVALSVKTTKSDTVACGDVIRFYDHTVTSPFTLVVGQYTQVVNIKRVHSIVEFYITPSVVPLLWYSLTDRVLEEFVHSIHAIPYGREGQLAHRSIWKAKRKALQHKGGIMKINPKIDSQTQRRVQCSCKLSELKSSIPSMTYTTEYRGISIPLDIISDPRIRH